MAQTRLPRLWVLVLPLLYVPDLGLSVRTSMGVIEPSDLALIIIFPVLLLRATKPSGISRDVIFAFWAFVGVAFLSTMLVPLWYEQDAAIHMFYFGLLKLAKFVAYSVIGYLVARNLHTERDFALALRWLAVGGFVLAAGIIGTAILRWTPEMLSVNKHLFPYKASNAISVCLGAMGVFYSVAPRRTESGLGRSFTLALLCALFSAMLLTGGRGGWFGTLVGLAYLVSTRRGWKAYAATALLILVAAVIVTRVAPVHGSASKLFKEEEELQPGEDRILGISDGARIMSWKHEGAKIVDAPVLGVGFYNRSELSGLWTTGSHNFFIQMALETGLIGFLMLMALLFSAWRSASVRGGSGIEPAVLRYNLAFRGAMVAACASSMTGEYLYGGLLLGTMSILFGIVAGCGALARAKAAAEGGSRAVPGKNANTAPGALFERTQT